MRIIAGRFKGRRLAAPTWEGLRPTSDRLRETLFNILATRVPGARVLDGYAGTGAVGIEALSRGAAHVTFVERDPRAAALIARNVAACRVSEGYTIERGDVAARLAQHASAALFDVILLDPPYADLAATGHVLDSAARCLAPDGLIVIEHATRDAVPSRATVVLTRDVRSGDSTLSFLAAR